MNDRPVRIRFCRALASAAAGVIATLLTVHPALAGQIYFQGFETDTSGWFSPTRVASGTGGITSSTGSFHATTAAGAGDYTTFGGYNFGAGGGVPTAFREFTTSLDIYLDLSGGWANDTRFDWDSAVSNAAGNFLRDFVFNGGFYDDTDATGSGARFVFSASNNAGRANSYPKNPGRDPFAITASGWYTFEEHFYDDGGLLAVDLSILDDSGTPLNTWMLGGDPISGVGGSRYGWFPTNEFSLLAIDNSSLSVADVPEPGTLALLAGLAGIGLRRRRKPARGLVSA